FFQAEDGIRDFHVTGVQTCALPIYHRRCAQRARQVREVVREQVPAVDDGDHTGTPSAAATVCSMAPAFEAISCSSRSGSESATMPAPAWMNATPRRTTMVRMVMHESMLPEKPK